MKNKEIPNINTCVEIHEMKWHRWILNIMLVIHSKTTGAINTSHIDFMDFILKTLIF